MKRFLCLLFVFMVGSKALQSQADAALAAKQQTHAETIVPPPVEEKFVIENPDARATWKVEGALYKAIFINPVNNLGQITVYDKTGKIVRKERELERQDFPAEISEYQEKKFPGEGFALWVSTDSTGHRLFYTQKNNSTYWFDKNGRPLADDGRGLSDTAVVPTR